MTAFRRIIPALFLFLAVGLSLPLGAQGTVVRRAAFDIGSASIKCTVADVDPATDNVVRIVEEFSRKVDFAEDLARSYDGNLGKEIMAEGLAALEEMKQKGLELKARQFSAVGGMTFRTAPQRQGIFRDPQGKTRLPLPDHLQAEGLPAQLPRRADAPQGERGHPPRLGHRRRQPAHDRPQQRRDHDLLRGRPGPRFPSRTR